MSGPDRELWKAACAEEVASLQRQQIYVEVPEDSLPTWSNHTRSASEVVDMLWVLKKKYDELLRFIKAKARATVRGDQESDVDKKMGLAPEQTFAPTVRHNTLKLLIAAQVARHHQLERPSSPLRFRAADVPVAFLRGTSLTGRPRYVRPPLGFRTYDRRGVPIVWKMMGNCYGRAVAPRIWNATIHSFLLDPIDGLGMTQSEFDPCYYFKTYANGTRLDMGLYVDDCWLADDAGALADADVDRLKVKFQIKLMEDPTHFLNMNVTVESPTRVKLTSQAYITSMADKYVPDWKARPKVELPATEKLTKAYERAQLREHSPSPTLLKRYGGKVGAMVYTSPCVRVDTCYAISRLSRALTFPTDELESCADDVIVYLAQTAADGVTFDGAAAGAATAFVETDSDWAVGHSTTGWCIFLSGAAVAYRSMRQACIAMSSTEAEIVAASAGAMEMVHVRGLLLEMGLPQTAPTPVYVDNSGAVELSRDRKSCHRSRHIDRRYFKIRELCAEGHLSVEHIDTKKNSADLLTKPLAAATYHEHRARAFNLPTKGGASGVPREGGVSE
jgi:hypothetical protein